MKTTFKGKRIESDEDQDLFLLGSFFGAGVAATVLREDGGRS